MQIEEGWRSFRVAGVNAHGEMQSWHSGKVFAHDYAHLQTHKANYLTTLANAGNTSLRVTHIINEEPPLPERDLQDYYYLD